MTDDKRLVSTSSFAQWIVKQYADSYSRKQITLSGVDVNPGQKTDKVNEKINELCELLIDDSENMLKLHEAAKECQRYNTGRDQDASFVYYVDLIDFMEYIEDEYEGDIEEAAKAVRDEINNQQMVVANISEGTLHKTFKH